MGRMNNANSQPGPADNRLNVARADDAVLVEVIGLGSMFLAPTLQAFVESELRAGFLNFIIDLKKCGGMDSTFMGTFIGLSLAVKKRAGWFCLVNVSEENHRLLNMLGVLHMVSIHQGSFPVVEGKSTSLYPTSDPYARQKQIHSAHRLLIDADPMNQERFGPFIKALEEEMSDIPTILPPPAPDAPSSEKSP